MHLSAKDKQIIVTTLKQEIPMLQALIFLVARKMVVLLLLVI